jgi:hypothetical protein
MVVVLCFLVLSLSLPVFAQDDDGTDFPDDTTVSTNPPSNYGPFTADPSLPAQSGTYPLKPIFGIIGGSNKPHCAYVYQENGTPVSGNWYACNRSTIGGNSIGFSMSLPFNNPANGRSVLVQYCSVTFHRKTNWGNGVYTQFWDVYPGTGSSCQDTQGSAGKVSGTFFLTWHKPAGHPIDSMSGDGTGSGQLPDGRTVTWNPVSITYP